MYVPLPLRGVTDVCVTVVDESEKMAAKMKGLDCAVTPKSAAVSMSSSTSSSLAPRAPHKDINTFVNNQLKFSTSTGHNCIPPQHMKCNILKAVTEERAKQGELTPSSILFVLQLTAPCGLRDCKN